MSSTPYWKKKKKSRISSTIVYLLSFIKFYNKHMVRKSIEAH